jgi:precorrin-6Y C5,15-methyltransferase (decarboxylating)
VVGIGADGWDGLSPAARTALRDSDVVLGVERQFDLLDPSVTAERVSWPSPLVPAIPSVLAGLAGRKVAVLASGDPMFYGIGSTLARVVGASRLHVFPAVSSVSLAAARLGWPLEDLEVVTLVGRPLSTLRPHVHPGARLLVLVPDGSGAAAVSGLLTGMGFGASELTVLENLGGPDELIRPAAGLDGPHAALAIVAVTCAPEPSTIPLTLVPGLPEDAFEFDAGQITKREIRALVLAELAPQPGQVLWDIGAGSGSVGIEWMRTSPSCRAIAIEPRADRCERIAANADSLGVPGLRIVHGVAPEALADLPAPDAVFIGGGATTPGVIEAALAALPSGGRLVANGVTLETETTLASWHQKLGGTLVRIAVQRAAPVGDFTGWRPGMPVTQWSLRKEDRS